MINKTIMQGRFTKYLELKHTQNDVPVCSFTIAWNEKYGEKETNCFLNCVSYRATAEFVSKYFSKGDQAIVEGKLTTRSYDDSEGKKRYITELIVDKVHFCGSKKNGNQSESNQLEVIEYDNDLPF